MGGGSSVLVIAGIWLALIGYAVLYTGVAKIGGNSSYHLGMALKGTPPGSTATGGAAPAVSAGAMQDSMIGMVPLGA